MVLTNTGAVEAYLAKQPAEARSSLERVRTAIRKALPGAEEVISYGIPACRLEGRCIVYYAGWKRHWSLYPVTEPIRAALGPELAGYEFSKGTVKFPLGEKVPEKLVARIVKELARAAAARAKAKPSSRKAASR
ncbi:MAG: DUF1801 domain-containing protein [Vicinamibacteria bacterium]|nr:DUF1801 domain-containing protein [Vicinamibacteria bacterium]